MKYTQGTSSRSNGVMKWIIGICLGFAAVVAIVMTGLYMWYRQQLSPLAKESTSISVVIPSGSTTKQIAAQLADKKVIKNALAFEWYVRLNNLRANLQAGTYALDPSQSVRQITAIISNGKIKKDTYTILPAKRLDQIKASMVKAGFSQQSVDEAFVVSNYASHPALANKPSGASLEGYLYPDTYEITANSTPTDIVKQSLDEMAKVLTPDLQDKLKKQGLTIHQAVTLASIVEQEAPGATDRRMAAQVFLNRLKQGIALGSDVTYRYAAAIVGVDPTPFIDSPYNTRKYAGLPPGPISNVSKVSLEAVANPIQSDYLFFVAGDDGVVHYSKTQAEHDALAKQYCIKLCSTY
jgi:UPF0755 protein